MKKITFLTAILIASISFAQIPNYVPTNGLVGWWPFNGNANDESGNGNNGTVNGATLTTDRFGIANKAYSFNGVDDFLLIPSDVSDFSISLWFNFSSPSNQFSELFYFEDFSASIVQNGNYIYIRKQNQIISSIDLSTSQIINNQWNHIVVKYNSVQNTIECVLNNIEFFSSSITSGGLPNLINDNMFQIAGRQFNNTNFFNGKLDDIGIWDRALTQQEITNLFNGVYNLPVELTQFSASCSENTTTINWQTASENNSAYFEVLQSREGEVWTSKTTTPAAGNSTSTIDYSYTDNNETSLVYYKLKQVDKDGQYKEYGPISANCNENNQLTIYPNPTTGEITLRGLEQFSNVSSLLINDINGTVVKELDPTTTLFNVETVQAGVYFLSITAGNKQEVVKIIKE